MRCICPLRCSLLRLKTCRCVHSVPFENGTTIPTPPGFAGPTFNLPHIVGNRRVGLSKRNLTFFHVSAVALLPARKPSDRSCCTGRAFLSADDAANFRRSVAVWRGLRGEGSRRGRPGAADWRHAGQCVGGCRRASPWPREYNPPPVPRATERCKHACRRAAQARGHRKCSSDRL